MIFASRIKLLSKIGYIFKKIPYLRHLKNPCVLLPNASKKCQTLQKSEWAFRAGETPLLFETPQKLNAFAAKRFKKRRSVSCRRNSSSTFWGCLFSVPKASRLAMKFECLAKNIEAFHRCFFWFFCLAIFLRVFGRLATGAAKHII